jgi:tryptophan synthase alpha chain
VRASDNGNGGAPEDGVARIAKAFAQTDKRAALMPYLMGGYPTLADSIRIGEACVGAGADVIELGMPYSDPLADGPVIHAAGTEALAAGANVAGVLEVARALAQSVPVVLMCYANMVYAPGAEAFVERLAKTGVSGLIVPDLPLGEGPEVARACVEQGLALVPLLAPTTTPERLAAIGASARGFMYTVSVVGTTGERSGRRRALRHRSPWASGSARPSTRSRPRRRARTA